MISGGSLLIPEGINILEAYIIAFIIDSAWGNSSCGKHGSVLREKIENIDDKTELYLGSRDEIVEIENLFLNIQSKVSTTLNSIWKNSFVF